jgi:hypothetical protein
MKSSAFPRNLSLTSLVVMACLFAPRAFAAQADLDDLVGRLDAGFLQTFDGQTLHRWQETYQNACLNEIPRLARLLAQDEVELPHDPFARHLQFLRQTLPQMQDKQVQAMDLHVQISQKWMSAPPSSQQATALRAQMSEQEKTVKVYQTIVATLQERITYLDKCARLATKSFGEAVSERQARAKPKTATAKPSTKVDTSGDSIAMPTGVTQEIAYDPKKGLSIGRVAELGPAVAVEDVPVGVTATSNVERGRPSSTDLDSALQEAARKCKDAYQRAYEDLLRKRRTTIDEAKAEIPKLEACVRQKTQELAEWKRRRQEAAPNSSPEQLRLLRQERDKWQAKAESMEDQAAKNDAARKWDIYQKELARVEGEMRKLQLLDETVEQTERQLIECQTRLQLMREKIAAAEKALGDSLERAIAAHRAKRFAEIERLLASRNLTALQRCAAQGFMDLDEILRELYR